MGSMIWLSLNGVEIDYGKNRYWQPHCWLFPPGSLTEIDYAYADDVVETKPGFETTLEEARFRLSHLGYSREEARTKFDMAVTRWNRTANLRLSFSDFFSAIANVDFSNPPPSEDLGPDGWGLHAIVKELLTEFDTDEAMLRDFIANLDFYLLLRALSDRAENRPLPLRWHHQDVVDNEWASLEDLTEIDRPTFIICHTVLCGRLQDHLSASTVTAFDNWLANAGLARATTYRRMGHDDSKLTLPTAVRNMIHHPENPLNVLSDDMLGESIELLLGIAKSLPTPLPGLE